MNKLYIIIVAYNGEKWIEKCLDSCAGHKVIIVDNHSTDSTVTIIKKNYPDVILLEQSENLGFGAANNLGISYALKFNCEYVFLLNQDAYLMENSITQLVHTYQKNNEYGILSPIHLNGKGDTLDEKFSNYLSKNKELLFDALHQKFRKDLYRVPFVNAAAWLIPKSTLLLIGGFDPIFHHYVEDDNYCQRAVYHNLKIGIVPEVYICHDREYREKERVSTTAEKLKLRERFFKYNWANINFEIGDKIKETKRKEFNLMIKSFLRLKFDSVGYYRKEIRLIANIKEEILRSRKINRQEGCHYLDYE